jgi:uncharacterized protein DUF6946
MTELPAASERSYKRQLDHVALKPGIKSYGASTLAQILVPTRSIEDWKHLLAKPDLHWKSGFSAMTLARSWEDAAPNGFPPEIASALSTAGRSDWRNLRLLIAIPEYRVPLPGGARASQTDLAAFARGDSGLIAIAVEGKVNESLGPTVGEKRAEGSAGVDERLAYLEQMLGLDRPCADEIRYQLLHRTVSALRIAQDFAAESAVMLVQSFSPDHKWHSDFLSFAQLFEKAPATGSIVEIGVHDGIKLYIGWCVGDQKFRADVPTA